MTSIKSETVKEIIFLSYANLAMAHMAIERKQNSYGKVNYMVRAKLLKGLKSGTMNIRTIFDDEKVKLQTGNICNYCGSNKNLALDHIFPQRFGGMDDAENLILACRLCNSSKGKKDLMEWMNYKGKCLPLLIIRRYLKLTYNYCVANNMLDKKLDDLENAELPFKINTLPVSFPNPGNLILNIGDLSLDSKSRRS